MSTTHPCAAIYCRVSSPKQEDGYSLDDQRWRDASKSAYDIDPEAAPVVQRIFRALASGRSFRGIAVDLMRDGIPAPAGGRAWNDTTIRNIARHPGYTGRAIAYGRRG